jgi:uncharacterized protein
MNNDGLQIRETTAGLEVHLHIQPRAKHGGISGIHNGALKVKVTAPPVDDAANNAVIEYFSDLLGVSKSSLQIISGMKSREKILQIKGLPLSRFRAAIKETER